MNKKYIDFVPKTKSVPRASVPSANAQEVDVEMREIFAERTIEERPKLGVIEDFSDKFVESEVAKRPLGLTDEMAKDGAKLAKSKKIPKISLSRKSRAAKSAEMSDKVLKEAMEEAANLNAKRMKIPERPFVNTDKVDKRPLSKNVYQPRKVVTPVEEPKGPVTIIEKPEKDSRISLIVTVIITIILGAAAGTVAFLLLPK